MTQPTNSTNPPATSPSSPRETVLGGAGQADATPDTSDKTPPEHIDSPLESIGKAVTEPVRDAADEDSDEVKPA